MRISTPELPEFACGMFFYAVAHRSTMRVNRPQILGFLAAIAAVCLLTLPIAAATTIVPPYASSISGATPRLHRGRAL
jgi:hypothetical protein